MTTNKNKDIIQLRSQEVQELIGHIPGGFMRYGIGTIFFLLISALLACNFIPYTEVKSFPLRILPNVSTKVIRSPYEGNIVHCCVSEDTIVSIGDTLLTIRTDEKLQILHATNHGKVKLCSFCVKNETVRKGQVLMEIYKQVIKPQPLFAIADTLPQSLSFKQCRTIEVDICGKKIPFKIVRTIEDKISGKRQALFQSEKYIEVTRLHWGEGKILTNDGVLLDKLIQIRKQY